VARGRYLIVNADDFGLSAGTNRGIIAAHERGVVTSASLMVRQPEAAEAAKYARARPQLSVGLHIDLGEWICRGEEWEQAYAVVSLDDAAAVAAEVERQFEAFIDLVGSKPTHLDSHQHIHRHEPAQSAVRALAQRHGLPLRHESPGIFYCGDFYGQGNKSAPFPEGVSFGNLIAILGTLPPGASELGCHPGADAALGSIYRDERLIELETLCDPRLPAALAAAGIELISFRDVAPTELLAGRA
jgi:chitin disaccharide deacetylase